MKRKMGSAVMIACLAASLGLGLVAVAQVVDAVPIQAAGSGKIESYVMPANPAYHVVKLTGTGQTPFGPANGIARLRVTLAPDGRPLAATDGVGVLTAANGDALYLTFSGLVRPAATPGPGRFGLDGILTFTGGKGVLSGAAGSGRLIVEADLNKNEFTAQLDGVITPIRP